METHTFYLIDLVGDDFFYSLFLKCLELMGFGRSFVQLLKKAASIDKQSIAKAAYDYIDNDNRTWVYDSIIPYETLPEWWDKLDEVYGTSFSTSVDNKLCRTCRLFESALDDLKYKRIEGYTYTD